jgi:hypothetical protein
MKIFATALLAFSVKATQEMIVNATESELSSTELLSTSVTAELGSLVEHLDEPSRGSRRLQADSESEDSEVSEDEVLEGDVETVNADSESEDSEVSEDEVSEDDGEIRRLRSERAGKGSEMSGLNRNSNADTRGESSADEAEAPTGEIETVMLQAA